METLLGLDPIEILEKIVEISPGQKEAERLIFLNRLDLLDYAMHSLPEGLLVEEPVCLSALDQCESLAIERPDLLTCKSRFDLDLSYYRHLLLCWLKYESESIEQDFFDWLETA